MERFTNLNIKVDSKKFNKLNELRNKIEHYYTDTSPNAVREVIATSFLLIRDFISEHLEEEPCNVLGEECWQSLLETTDVYQAEEKACRQTFENTIFGTNFVNRVRRAWNLITNQIAKK